MAFDINALSLGEVDKIETLSGQSISNMGDDNNPKGKMLAAMAFIAKRREQLAAGEKVTFTFADAMGLGLTEAKELLGMSDEQATETVTKAKKTKAKKTAQDVDPTEDPT